MTDDLLDVVLDARHPFALLHRPEVNGPDTVELLLGEVSEHARLRDVPEPGPGGDVLVLVPYRQIVERGFPCLDDGEPLLAMTVARRSRIGVAPLLARLPRIASTFDGQGFDIDDDQYEAIIRRIVRDEIGGGQGSNFVIRRSFTATIPDHTPANALSAFGRLLERETGAYWTFLVHTGDRTFIGASPERQVSVDGDRVVMNPISGTYRFPSTGPDVEGVLAFLADQKEADELYMVVDEELKMMARVCRDGGRVIGPRLKEMAWLAHTEYLIEGRTDLAPLAVLRETMFAPAVTGSPLESAFRVIARHEPTGRGYYSGVIGLLSQDERGGQALDSAVLIRAAEIDPAGTVRIGVGATLVRHSDPSSEVAETHAKAAGLLTTLSGGVRPRLADHPDVQASLQRRNDTVGRYWLLDDAERTRHDPRLAGRSALVVDAEDNFTAMVAHQLRSLGLSVVSRRYDESLAPEAADVVVLGPGPGDPRDLDDPKVARLSEVMDALLAERRPLLALCLSHQILCSKLGFEVEPREQPNQGVQRVIDLFGSRERVGFYNTFAARSERDAVEHEGLGRIEISRDPDTGDVHALRAAKVLSLQFHAESILTRDGVRILRSLLHDLLAGTPARTHRHALAPS
jgi:phenazine biosynthesis protein phzE